VTEAVARWESIAADVGVKPDQIEDVSATLRLGIA